MKLLQNVLIKLSRGGMVDQVLYIDNLPENMLYEMRYPMKVEGQGNSQHWVPDTSKEKVPTLYEGLKESKVGDGGIVFDMEKVQNKERYAQIERYIYSVYPHGKMVPKAVPYSADPSKRNAPPLALNKVPRVVLPVLSPSESKEDSVADSTTASLNKSDNKNVDIEEIKRQAIEEHLAKKKEEAKEKMAKARAARSSK